MAVHPGGVVRYTKTTSELMSQVPLIDGQILFISDTAELYIDDVSVRKKINCCCENSGSSATPSSTPASSSAASSSVASSSVASSAPSSSSEVEAWRHIPITVPSYAANVTIYDTPRGGFSFTTMREVANTSNGNYERLEVAPSTPLSPSTSISSLVGSTIYVNIPNDGLVHGDYIVVVFEDANGVKSDADIIPIYDASLQQTGEVTLTIAWFNNSTHLYTDTISNLPASYDKIQKLYLRPPITATDFKVTDAANGYTIIDTSNAIFNCAATGVVLVPDGINEVSFTGQSIPTAVAGNAIELYQIGTSQSAASVTESLYDRGILPKPMSLYSNDDIGSTINIPLNNGSTIPFTIVALNWYKCTDTSIGKTLVLWANEAVSYQSFDTQTVRCEKSEGCGDINARYQGGRAQWEVCELRAWLNNDWLNTLDSTLLSQNIAEVVVPNVANIELYDGGKTTNDKAFILSPNELNNKPRFSGWGSEHVAGTCMPYFADRDNAPLLRAKADIYWTRSWISWQQKPASSSSPVLNSDSSVMIVQKNSALQSKFTTTYNSLTKDGGTQYDWCSPSTMGQFTEETWECPSKGEYASAVAFSPKAVVPAIVLYDKYS